MGVEARQPSADDDLPTLWIFTLPSDSSGPQGFFPHAVCSTARVAEAWIAAHRASGLLTEYPVDLAVYDWATERGHFKPQRDDQRSASFIETFSDAGQTHCHFEDGRRLYANEHHRLDLPAAPKEVWTFNGSGRRRAFPSAVFASRRRAEAWIARVGASGTLLHFVVDAADAPASAQRFTYTNGYCRT